MGFPGGKEPAVSAGDVRDADSIPGSGRSPGGGHSNPPQYILAWRIPWTEEPGGLQSIGLHRVGHDLKQLSTHMPQVGTWGYALLEKHRKLALKYSNVSFLKPG